ncbi:DNA polymerase theta [Phymastichus coffea]|uniref:DNA polymerase theta n=1 Tax=Phymastichus coffea TaxID=108790 RepID=UPI00273B76C4|nr:DNA polymerase theta [Phymastichus coffea]
MSHKTAKKKRLKTSQDASCLLKQKDRDNDNCLNFNAEKYDENEVSYTLKNILVNTNSRIVGKKYKTDESSNFTPLKKSKCSPLQFLPISKQVENVINPCSKDSSYKNSSTSLSVARSYKCFASFKNNKSDIFNNITASFCSSKILSGQILSDIDSQKRLELSSWGLPPLIVERYEARGIKSMFPWQVECLANKKILEENKNLVYSAPTSAGKTLVAEFLMLKTVLEKKKKAIFILPFVSVVREKMFYFQDLLSDSGVRVEGFMGGVAPPGGFSSVHIAIATIEKANSIINRLMEDGDLMTLGAVIIDELHLLGDPSRGYILELLLTKLKYMSINLEHVDIQLIGMSATLPNLSLIADWLDAELYKTDFRPIPLNELCKIGLSLYDSKMNAIKELPMATDIVNDTDNIIQLCIETIDGGHGVLIFCPTKNWCEKLSIQMASTFLQLGRDNTFHGQILRKNIDLAAVQEILAQLQHCPVGLDNVLKRTVSFGVAFHHAGLTMDERDIIEGAFRIGALKVLIATSTLSSGVNLPARRVIIRSPIFNGKPLDKLTYQQMIGRAGRMGKDTQGESILICKPNERPIGINLMSSTLEPIESCLEDSGPLIRALLEAIASQVVRTPRDLDLYSKCTFVFKCASDQVKEMVDEAVHFLISNEFLQFKNSEENEQRIVATCLGKACLSASIAPREGLFLFEELQRARKCFVLDTELHVIYLVTPFNTGSQISTIDWMSYAELWRSLSESEKRVGQLVGVEERFLMAAVRGIVKPSKALNIHRRFFTAMALHDLVREVPLNTVCKKYNCNRGLLQSLQQSSSTFAGMVTNFCKELKWDCMELLFAQFQTRLHFGVSRDLLDLLRVPSLNGLRARSLYKHGITTVAELAFANKLDIEEALNKALPFESEKDFDGETEAEIAKKTKMRTVFITGKDGLTAHEAADLVIREARTLLQNELGIRDMQWRQAHSNVNPSEPSSPDGNRIALKSSSILSIITPTRSISVQDHPVFQINLAIEKTPDGPLKVFQKQSYDIVDKSLSISNENLSASTNEVNENKQTESRNSHASATEYLSKANENASILPGIRVISQCKNQQSSSRILRSHSEKAKSLIKDNHIAICTQDSLDSNNSPKLSKKENTLVKGSHIAVSTQDFLKNTDSPNHQKKAGSSLNKNCVTIRSQNFGVFQMEKQEKAQDNQMSESFVISECALEEMMQAVEKQNIKNTVPMPVPIIDGKANYEKPRISAGSNCTKSPSLFSDSSFLDPQICSILEQNVIDPNCFADFEKSSFTQQKAEATKTFANDRSIEVFKKTVTTPKLPDKSINIDNATPPKRNNNESKTKEEPDKKLNNTNRKNSSLDKCTQINCLKKISQPLTWVEDSWDQSKNLPFNEKKSKEDKEKQSPSLLQTSRLKTRLKTIAATQAALSKIQASTSQSPVISSPISVFRHQIFNKIRESPIKSVRSYESRNLPCSSKKSDSDESILNSQSPLPIIFNKTRSRIEKKLLVNTQKLFKSQKILNLQSKYSIEQKLVKPNSDYRAESDSSDSEDVDSIELFDSDDTVRSQEQKAKKIKKHVSPTNKTKPLRSDSYFSVINADEKIRPESIVPVNVVNSKRTFRLFREDIESSLKSGQRNNLALSLVTEPHLKEPVSTIGKRIVGIEEKKKKEKKSNTYIYDDRKLTGVIVSWGINSLYHLPFTNTRETKITIRERISFLRDILTNRTITMRCFNAKEVYKMLYVCCDIEPSCKFLDPKTGDWLLNSDTCNKSLTELTAQYFPTGIDIATIYENNYRTYALTGTMKAGIKVVLTWYIVEGVLNAIKQHCSTLLECYEDIEMPTILILARMELRGFGINTPALQELSTVIKNDLSRAEEEAFRLAGRKFNFYSSKEVSQVLGLVKKGRGCTNKNTLRSCENPISKLVTLWRKLSTVQTKIVYPLLQLEKKNKRIHGNCITYTVTGRVSMHEPNLQTIPRDFTSEISGCILSVRMAFVPVDSNVMLSADFCQLELRILAHFSNDPVLCKLLQGRGDIFKNIAARLHGIMEEGVNDDMRQRAKQLCYAMIYGMGVKSLAESLFVSESEAKDYLESFMGTYKGIRSWLNSAIEQARLDGFVSTLTGRRRSLPGINSKISSIKLQAERQAVNTKVQGSAADITKKAMVLIENKLKDKFSHMPMTFPTTQDKRKLRSTDEDSQLRGAYLVLQLHDELLYEVNSRDLQQVVSIIKESMEHAFQLRVPLPVKIKVGSAWGNLEEYQT